MAILATAASYVEQARTLLQDTVAPYRYPDADLVMGLSMAMEEARRTRPDLFLATSFVVPVYTAADSTAVAIDAQYRLAFLYFVVGMAQLRDEEDTQDARAAALISLFRTQLTTGQA